MGVVPAGDGWLHEVKFDGYRVQVHKVGSRVVIYSRNDRRCSRRPNGIKLEGMARNNREPWRLLKTRGQVRGKKHLP